MSYEKARSLLSRGLSRPAIFKIVIDSTTNNANFAPLTNDYLEFYCTSASVPSITHQTVQVGGQDMVGVMRQQPAQVTYGKPFTIEVIERSDYTVYREIKKWFDRTANGSNSKNESSHRMKYYDDITCDIQLRKYEYSQYASPTSQIANKVAKRMVNKGYATNEGYRTALKVNFRNAYPTEIGEIQYSTEAVDQMVRYNIAFNYETYDTQVNDFFSAEHATDFDNAVLDFLNRDEQNRRVVV